MSVIKSLFYPDGNYASLIFGIYYESEEFGAVSSLFLACEKQFSAAVAPAPARGSRASVWECCGRAAGTGSLSTEKKPSLPSLSQPPGRPEGTHSREQNPNLPHPNRSRVVLS